jgi:hypothetical protein
MSHRAFMHLIGALATFMVVVFTAPAIEAIKRSDFLSIALLCVMLAIDAYISATWLVGLALLCLKKRK